MNSIVVMGAGRLRLDKALRGVNPFLVTYAAILALLVDRHPGAARQTARRSVKNAGIRGVSTSADHVFAGMDASF